MRRGFALGAGIGAGFATVCAAVAYAILWILDAAMRGGLGWRNEGEL